MFPAGLRISLRSGSSSPAPSWAFAAAFAASVALAQPPRPANPPSATGAAAPSARLRTHTDAAGKSYFALEIRDEVERAEQRPVALSII
ncbi:MAG TPA: hypothetical protein VNC50_20135, partial [Planctomycetia bacterium]|nr:hypothetical protein [Planctomycetia bacterium]